MIGYTIKDYIAKSILNQDFNKETVIERDVVGFSNYKVSTTGVVTNKEKNNVLKHNIRKGYAFVKLSKDGIRHFIGVHRVVGMSFVDGFKDGLEINHKDKNRLNNDVSNLEWVTHEDNVRYSKSKPILLEYEDGSTLWFPSAVACGEFFGHSMKFNIDKYIKRGSIPKWGFTIKKYDGTIFNADGC